MVCYTHQPLLLVILWTYHYLWQFVTDFFNQQIASAASLFIISWSEEEVEVIGRAATPLRGSLPCTQSFHQKRCDHNNASASWHILKAAFLYGFLYLELKAPHCTWYSICLCLRDSFWISAKLFWTFQANYVGFAGAPIVLITFHALVLEDADNAFSLTLQMPHATISLSSYVA